MKEKSFDKFKDSIVNGRRCVHSIEFKSNNSPFSAYYEATNHLNEMGYCTGSMCGSEPIGFSDKHDYIAKWRNIDVEDREKLDGIIIPLNSFREGSCSIVFFNEPNY